MNKPIYTTQLQAGLGLVAETGRLLECWEIGMVGQDLLRQALASGHFPTMSARRLRNIIIEAFAPRYLVSDAGPARILKILLGRVQATDWRQLLFLFTCRANPILADYVREVYWTRYASGAQTVTKEETIGFIRRAIDLGHTTKRWSESTIIRMSRYLLGACTDFGMLGPMKSDARGIIPFRISPTIVSILAHDLHFHECGDNAMVGHTDWTLFGLEPQDVLQELKRLALRGEIIVQSAAAITQIGWKHKSMEDCANGLAEG